MAKQRTIFLAGGGTLGPVVPLAALGSEWRRSYPADRLVWIGTRQGVERIYLKPRGYLYHWLPIFKLPRYLSWQWLIGPLSLLVTLPKSLYLCWRYRPSAVVSAGGFSAVFISWVAKLWGAKIFIHQQDVRPSLSNKLLWPIADRATVVFEDSQKFFPSSRWIGNPARPELETFVGYDQNKAKRHFVFDPNKPLLLVIGGGTGASGLNNLVTEALPELLPFTQVLHLTGRGKGSSVRTDGYSAKEFLDGDDLPLAMVAADLVVSRGGLSTLTELAFLRKTVLIAPLPDSHQLFNVRYLAARLGAVDLPVKLTAKQLTTIVRDFITRPELAATLGDNLGKLFKVQARSIMVRLLSQLLDEK